MSNNTLEKCPWGTGSWGFNPNEIGLYSHASQKKTLKVLHGESISLSKRDFPRLRRKRKKFSIMPEHEALRIASLLLFSATAVGLLSILIIFISP